MTQWLLSSSVIEMNFSKILNRLRFLLKFAKDALLHVLQKWEMEGRMEGYDRRPDPNWPQADAWIKKVRVQILLFGIRCQSQLAFELMDFWTQGLFARTLQMKDV